MTDSSVHHKSPSAASTSLSYPVRRMRNTAVLVKWIEEHQSNPYPTKAEKQYLAYYSGMNLTQLSTWFANARRRIKKIGMKTWLEGRSTFSLDYIPSPLQRSSLSSDSYGELYKPIQQLLLKAFLGGREKQFMIMHVGDNYRKDCQSFLMSRVTCPASNYMPCLCLISCSREPTQTKVAR